MKPTTSSASKTHEKVESKSPPRAKAAAPKPKVNGVALKSTKKPSGSSKAEPSALAAATGGEVEDPTDVEPTGNETPLSHANGTADEVLEATPAGLGGEETIR